MFSLWKRGMAEMVGTGLLVLVGAGSATATGAILGPKGTFSMGDLLGISVAFGLVVTAMVYTIGKVSGCHINPAVTFALALTRRVPWKEVPVYWLSQYVGATIGALLIWAAFPHWGDIGTWGMVQFKESGPGSISYLTAFAAEAVGTGILMFTVLGIVDSRAPGDLAGLVIGFVVVSVILYLGPVTNAEINPARGFGPDLVYSLINAKSVLWAQYLPVYLAGPFVGAGLAAFVYDFLAKPDKEVEPIKGAVETTAHGHVPAS